MPVYASASNPVVIRNGYRFFLAFVWILGLVGGVICLYPAEDSFLSLMRTFSYNRLSIVSVLALYLLPCFFTALAVCFSGFRLLYLLCFSKAFSFSYVSALVVRSFGSAGWLVWLLLLGPELLNLPLLFFFWLRAPQIDRRYSFSSALLLMALGFLGCSLSYRVISPFSAFVFDSLPRMIG